MTSSKLILYKRFSTELFPESQRKSNEIKKKMNVYNLTLHTFLGQKKQVKIIKIKKSFTSDQKFVFTQVKINVLLKYCSRSEENCLYLMIHGMYSEKIELTMEFQLPPMLGNILMFKPISQRLQSCCFRM